MQMTATDLAYLKGEASAQSGDTPDMALLRVDEHGYRDAPPARRDAFVAGFLSMANAPIALWLDDERKAPGGWVHAKTEQEAIAWLSSGRVVAISLDHDLGEVAAGDGYEVISAIEQLAADNQWDKVPKVIRIHTANPPARARMEAALAAIERMRQENR